MPAKTKLVTQHVAVGPACLGFEHHYVTECVAHVLLPDGSRRWLMRDGCVFDVRIEVVGDAVE